MREGRTALSPLVLAMASAGAATASATAAFANLRPRGPVVERRPVRNRDTVKARRRANVARMQRGH